MGLQKTLIPLLSRLALDIDPSSTKALLRRAQAYRHTDKFKEAKIDLIKAYQLAPGTTYLLAIYCSQHVFIFGSIFHGLIASLSISKEVSVLVPFK